ncbi:type II secretion system protein GspL [Novilysobacter arseniciresistens]|uniref:type II secretion system protein GspL n=1 Tax=Novilysobacter arseniciresistens TaxID=1385522 RepID=UPI0009E05C6D|nr:type II secretion system protein GspL [Lysobacter arseniciresistens]
MTPALQLFLLPSDPDGDIVRLRVDAAGRVLARERFADSEPGPVDAGARNLLVVPGADCHVLWLDLPARNPLQALAAARLLVADHLAVAADCQHVAIGPQTTEGRQRLVVCVDASRMRGWLDRTAAQGITADAVVPAPLLLPMPDDPDAVTVAGHAGEWLVRGERLAFAAEPALADAVIDERRRAPIEDLDEALAAGALSPPIDLLQHDFARIPPQREGWPAWRRAAVLAAVLAASPALLLGAKAIHHARAADALAVQSRALARTVLPSLAATDTPLPAVRAQLAGLRAGDTFARATAALSATVAAIDGAEIDTLSFSGETLVATIAHADPRDVDRLRDAVAASGLSLEATGSRNTSGRIHTTVELAAQP